MVLLTIGVVLAAIFSPGCAETSREPERHQVVIVGAGVSGIGAAATLLEHNVTDVILLEAADRIGGRVNTVEFGGIFVDKGAEFVHGDAHNSVFDIVKSHDMLVSYDKLFFKPETFVFTNTAGDSFNSTYMSDLIGKAFDSLDDLKTTSPNSLVADYFNTKVDELLKTNNVDPKIGEAIRRVAEQRHCSNNALDSLDQIGASTEFSEEGEGDTTLKWKSEVGYKILFQFLLKKFPNPKEELPIMNKTLLGKHVTQIKYGEGKPVEVQCADGSSYLADHVIMTVSLGVLKKHAETIFHPALPERKTATIKTMGFGVLGKIFALFPTRWWPKDVSWIVPLLSDNEIQEVKNTTVHGHWMAESLGFHLVLGNDRILEIWLSGKACRTMESLTEEQVIDGVVEYMGKTIGKNFNFTRPESILRSSWASNPLTIGSYSFHSVEGDKQNLSNSDLAAPVLDNNKPVLLFAGEATNTDGNIGTVHGALDTGRREAHNLIQYLTNNPVL